MTQVEFAEAVQVATARLRRKRDAWRDRARCAESEVARLSAVEARAQADVRAAQSAAVEAGKRANAGNDSLLAMIAVAKRYLDEAGHDTTGGWLPAVAQACAQQQAPRPADGCFASDLVPEKVRQTFPPPVRVFPTPNPAAVPVPELDVANGGPLIDPRALPGREAVLRAVAAMPEYALTARLAIEDPRGCEIADAAIGRAKEWLRDWAEGKAS